MRTEKIKEMRDAYEQGLIKDFVGRGKQKKLPIFKIINISIRGKLLTIFCIRF